MKSMSAMRLAMASWFMVMLMTLQLWDVAGRTPKHHPKHAVKRQKLSVDFYEKTCPDLEVIIRRFTQQKLKEAPTTAAGTVRLFFHDCFVDGCDASVTLSSTPGNKAERDADINLSLAGDAFDAVVRAKAAVEEECPETVSCADILAIITRDFVTLTGGPSWEVRKGRRDGRISNASHVTDNVPESFFEVDQLLENFKKKGFNKLEMVALSGAHTFGFSHCDQFNKRLYNFTNDQHTDPTLAPSFASSLKAACPQEGWNVNLVEPFDPVTPFAFDNVFFTNLQRGLGLITSDQVLFTDKRTRGLVFRFANNSTDFFQVFAKAMDKLSAVGVKTGRQGEIRRDCSKVND